MTGRSKSDINVFLALMSGVPFVAGLAIGFTIGWWMP